MTTAQRERTAWRRLRSWLAGPRRHSPVVASAPDEATVLDSFAATLLRAADANPSDTLRLSLEHWSDPNRQSAYARILRAELADGIPNFQGSLGLDFGCWTGFASYLMVLMGARRVIGVDVVDTSIAAAREWTRAVDERRLQFLCAEVGDRFSLMLPDGHFDWIVLSQVYCNLNPAITETVLDEIVRVLRPGGRLYLNDSNNPRCAAVRERLLDTYRRFELGAGDGSAPDGEIYRERLALVREIAPALADEDAAAIARGTAYGWRPDIEAAVEAFRTAGTYPQSFFEPDTLRAVVRANVGNAATNPTDPVAIAGALEARGLTCEVAVAPGAAALRADRLEEELVAHPSFHLRAVKSPDAGCSAFDVASRPYVVVADETPADTVLDRRHKALHTVYGPDFTLGMRDRKAPAADMADFAELLDALVDTGRFHFCALADLALGDLPRDRVPLCFKHDVDADLESAVSMARLEAERGVRASFYLLHTALYYGEFREGSFHRFEEMGELYREIQSLGHEVGLHFNPYHVYREHGVDGAAAIVEELAWLRSLGLEIRGGYGHSSAAVQGTESVEIFLENLSVRPHLAHHDIVRRDAVCERKGIPAPRAVLSAEELGLEYFGEFMLRTWEYSYWSVVTQERCRPAVNPKLTLPERAVSTWAMVEYMAREQNAPYQILNIHPETYGLRASPERAGEAATRSCGTARTESQLLGEVWEPGRVQVGAGRGVAGGRTPVVNFANRFGMLDFEPPVENRDESGQPAVVILGGTALDAPGVHVPSQLQGWLRDYLRAAGGVGQRIFKFAQRGAGPADYARWSALARSEFGALMLLVFATDEFIAAAGDPEAAARALAELAEAGESLLCVVDDVSTPGIVRLDAFRDVIERAPENAQVFRGVFALGELVKPGEFDGTAWTVRNHERVAEVLAPWLTGAKA